MRFVIREPADDRNVNVTSGHPLKEAVTLAAAVGVAALIVLMVLFFLADAVAARVSPQVEVRTFGGALSGLTIADTRLPDVQRTLDGLLAVAPASGYTHRLVAVAGRPNAAAVIGGTLVVTTGLLDTVESENELAFVLAHELGHFAHRDQIRGLGRALAGQLVLGALFGWSYGDSAHPVSQLGQLEQLRHSREQEHAADRYALDLLSRRFGHVGGASDFFRRMSHGERGWWAWSSTHPMAADRIQAIDRLAAEHHWPTDGRLEPLPARFRTAGR